MRPVGSFARPPPAPRRHSKQPDEEQEDDELCVVVYDLEDGEVGAEDEVEMAEAGGGEVEETEGINQRNCGAKPAHTRANARSKKTSAATTRRMW